MKKHRMTVITGDGIGTGVLPDIPFHGREAGP